MPSSFQDMHEKLWTRELICSKLVTIMRYVSDEPGDQHLLHPL